MCAKPSEVGVVGVESETSCEIVSETLCDMDALNVFVICVGDNELELPRDVESVGGNSVYVVFKGIVLLD